jgi:hypothetical protein
MRASVARPKVQQFAFNARPVSGFFLQKYQATCIRSVLIKITMSEFTGNKNHLSSAF